MNKKRKKLYSFIPPAAMFVLAVFACLFLYQFDNKYTAANPKGENGLLTLSEQSINENPIIFLVEGWEYYSGRLLAPADFQRPQTPDAYIFIGQYGGFDGMSAKPHGSASYRLTIQIPPHPDTYLLELPEIFSAYRAYVNGTLVQAMGQPEPEQYTPKTGNRTVRIQAEGRIEILIAVSDFSHLYSGLVYPPAFGQPEAVNSLLSARLIFRSIFLAFALAIGVIALLVGIAGRTNRLSLLFSLLCLFFVGYTSYPVIKTLTSAFYPFYTIENVSFCAMLVTVFLLQKSVYGKMRKRDWLFIVIGALMCLFSLLLPFLLTGGSLQIIAAYSYSVTAYQWITAAYLTVSAVRTATGRTRSKTLLYGILIFDVALIMDRLLPFHEPIVTGWFPEFASFALVLCVGTVIAKEVKEKYKDSTILEERANSMERLAEIQQTNFELLRERIEETKTARHDLRHHFVMIEGFLQARDFENLEAYVQKFQDSIRPVQPISYSKNPIINVLIHHYAMLAEKENIRLTLKLEITGEIKVSEVDLCSLLSNLLENGLEACKRQKTGERFITLSMGQKPSMLSIRMENSTQANLTQHGGMFLSSKGQNRKGYGLDSIHSIAKRHAGDTEFKYDKSGTFTSTVLLTFTP